MLQTKTLVYLNGYFLLFCGVYVAILFNTLVNFFSINNFLGPVIVGIVLILGALYMLNIIRSNLWNQNSSVYSIIYIDTFIFIIGLFCLIFNPFEFTLYGNVILGGFLAIIEFFGLSLLAKVSIK